MQLAPEPVNLQIISCTIVLIIWFISLSRICLAVCLYCVWAIIIIKADLTTIRRKFPPKNIVHSSSRNPWKFERYLKRRTCKVQLNNSSSHIRVVTLLTPLQKKAFINGFLLSSFLRSNIDQNCLDLRTILNINCSQSA